MADRERKSHSRKGASGAGYINEEAEQVLIASVLRDNSTFEDISDMVLPEHFSSEKHQYAWAAIGNLISRGARADAITILPHIHYEPDPASNETKNAEYFGKELRLLHRPRGELKGYAEVAVSAYEGRMLTGIYCKYQDEAQAGKAGVLDSFMAEATALHAGKPAETYRHIKGEAMSAVDKYMDRKARAPGAITGLSTGYPHLDHLLDGLCKKCLYVLAARPKQGKTSLGSAISMNAAKAGAKVVFFSMEMSREQLVGRMLTVESGIDGLRLRRGSFSDDEESALIEAADAVDQLNIYIDEVRDHDAGRITRTLSPRGKEGWLHAHCRRLSAAPARHREEGRDAL